MLCSLLLLLHEFGRGQHRYALLGCSVIVYMDTLDTHCLQWCEVRVNSYVTTKQYWSRRYLVRCGQRVNHIIVQFHSLIASKILYLIAIVFQVTKSAA